MTVSGLTITRAWRQPGHRQDRMTQKTLSAFRSNGRGLFRFRTDTCCRRARISVWSAARSAKISMILCMPERVSGGDAKFQSYCDGWNKWEGQVAGTPKIPGFLRRMELIEGTVISCRRRLRCRSGQHPPDLFGGVMPVPPHRPGSVIVRAVHCGRKIERRQPAVLAPPDAAYVLTQAANYDPCVVARPLAELYRHWQLSLI